MYSERLSAGIPILILSMRKLESDPFLSSYQVSRCLKLDSFSRPWMVGLTISDIAFITLYQLLFQYGQYVIICL